MRIVPLGAPIWCLRSGSFAKPRAVYGEDESVWVKPGAASAGCEIVAAMRFAKATLQPGEERTWCVYMGITDRERIEECRKTVLSTYGGKANAELALQKVKKEWVDKVNVHYESGDPDWDNYMYWVTFQPVLRRMYGCSFLPYHDYGKGGPVTDEDLPFIMEVDYVRIYQKRDSSR